MGSLFARPPARAAFEELRGTTIALDPGAGKPITEVEMSPPLVLCLGAEREGLPESVVRSCEARVSIPVEPGAESLNVAVAAALALYERRRH